MGDGIDLARELAPEHAALLDNLKDQLLIVFVKRMGGSVSFPVEEIDDTSQDVLTFNVKDGVFNFTAKKKH